MVSNSTRRPYHHGNLRESVIDLACEVLEREGREALSLRDLARRLDVSHSAPAHHFVDRDGLLDALVARALTDLDALAGRVAARRGSRDPVTQLTDFLLAFTRYGAEHPQLVRLMLERKDSDHLKVQAAATFRAPVGYLDAARAAGTVTDPPGTTAEEVLEVVLLGLLDVAARSGPSKRLDRIASASARVVLAGLSPG